MFSTSIWPPSHFSSSSFSTLFFHFCVCFFILSVSGHFFECIFLWLYFSHLFFFPFKIFLEPRLQLWFVFLLHMLFSLSLILDIIPFLHIRLFCSLFFTYMLVSSFPFHISFFLWFSYFLLNICRDLVSTFVFRLSHVLPLSLICLLHIVYSIHFPHPPLPLVISSFLLVYIFVPPTLVFFIQHHFLFLYLLVKPLTHLHLPFLVCSFSLLSSCFAPWHSCLSCLLCSFFLILIINIFLLSIPRVFIAFFSLSLFSSCVHLSF